MTLNPWRLHLLDVFARVGTVRATAAELLLSPSTVSQQLGVLETETGATLFERSGRSLALTPAGELLVERARDLRDHMDAIEAEIHDVTTTPAGSLRIGGFASSVASILSPAVEVLAREHPRLTVELLEIEPREATTALHQGRCEVMVTVDETDGSLFASSLSVVPLATDPLMAVLPVSHPLAGRSSVELADLADDAWALDAPGTYLGELVPRECRVAGFEPRVSGRFSSYGVMVAHVAAGLSVAVLPELATRGATGTVSVPVAGLAQRRIIAAVRTGGARRLAIVAAIEALRASAQSATSGLQ